MKVQYSARAAAEYKTIARYYKNIDHLVAGAVAHDIRKTVKLLSRHPSIGKSQDVQDIRRTISPRYGYLIYYREVPGSHFIEIVTILHGRQERPYNDN